MAAQSLKRTFAYYAPSATEINAPRENPSNADSWASGRGAKSDPAMMPLIEQFAAVAETASPKDF